MSETQSQTADDEQIHATVDVEELIHGLQRQATHDGSDWVVKVPRDGGDATVAQNRDGYYPNPSTAPIHVEFEEFIDPDWIRPPRMASVYSEDIGVPNEKSEWTDTDRETAYEALVELQDIWQAEVASRVRGSNSVEWVSRDRAAKYPDIELTVVATEE